MKNKWMINKKVWSAIAAICLLYACEHDTDVKLPPYTPMLVVYAYVGIGQHFEVAVSKTSNSPIVNLNQPDYVNNATVVLYENGIRKDTLEENTSTHRYESSTVIAVAGNTYKVIVEAAGFKTAEATAIAPMPLSASLVNYKTDARVDENGSNLNDITFHINDPADKNYYLAEVYSAVEVVGASTLYTFCTYSYDASVEQYQGQLNPFESGSCMSNTDILINDKNFNGTAKDIMVSGQADALRTIPSGNETHRPYLKLNAINLDYYNYLKSSINIDLVNDNPFIDPFMVKGNVKNGFGLFTVYSSRIDTLRE